MINSHQYVVILSIPINNLTSYFLVVDFNGGVRNIEKCFFYGGALRMTLRVFCVFNVCLHDFALRSSLVFCGFVKILRSKWHYMVMLTTLNYLTLNWNKQGLSGIWLNYWKINKMSSNFNQPAIYIVCLLEPAEWNLFWSNQMVVYININWKFCLILLLLSMINTVN